jgi:hypothetical protein
VLQLDEVLETCYCEFCARKDSRRKCKVRNNSREMFYLSYSSRVNESFI